MVRIDTGERTSEEMRPASTIEPKERKRKENSPDGEGNATTGAKPTKDRRGLQQRVSPANVTHGTTATHSVNVTEPLTRGHGR